MPTGWTLIMLLTMNPGAEAPDVRAYLITDGRGGAYAARTLAGSILGRAGVRLGWVVPEPRGRTVGDAVRIELAEDSAPDLLPGALAVAYPYSGCKKSITVFMDRIRSIAAGRAGAETAFLGYVLAHEIAHVVQGIDRHSEEGVMKASWSLEDRAAIFRRRLDFEEDDIRLIQHGLSRGACHAPGGATARSAAGNAGRPARP